jgi:hypothetical protein
MPEDIGRHNAAGGPRGVALQIIPPLSKSEKLQQARLEGTITVLKGSTQ